MEGSEKTLFICRLHPQSDFAIKLRNTYSYSYQNIAEFREGIDAKSNKRLRITEDKREFIALYTTDTDNAFLVECMTNAEKLDARRLLLNEDEQTYEISVNYAINDPFATIESVQKLTKMRKLNRAIGDNLKMLYDYKCQICGNNFGKSYDANIVEAHHLDPFVVSMNNDSGNQIIICPNHHRVIHSV
ncbi:MAG: HNH endonuclease, partial [Bacteroidota bacterium]